MTRLKKELMKKHIIFEADEYDIVMKGMEYDQCRKLVDITDKFIITVYHSAVLDSRIHIFDRHTFMQVAAQNLFPETNIPFFARKNKWDSDVYEEPCNPEEGFCF